MNCPECNSQMDQGVITPQENTWMPGPIQQLLQPIGLVPSPVSAFYCRDCGRVELPQNQS